MSRDIDIVHIEGDVIQVCSIPNLLLTNMSNMLSPPEKKSLMTPAHQSQLPKFNEIGMLLLIAALLDYQLVAQ